MGDGMGFKDAQGAMEDLSEAMNKVQWSRDELVDLLDACTGAARDVVNDAVESCEAAFEAIDAAWLLAKKQDGGEV